MVKSDLFIRALLLDRLLVTEKTTRTPRVHLVLVKYHNYGCFVDRSSAYVVALNHVIVTGSAYTISNCTVDDVCVAANDVT